MHDQVNQGRDISLEATAVVVDFMSLALRRLASIARTPVRSNPRRAHTNEF